MGKLDASIDIRGAAKLEVVMTTIVIPGSAGKYHDPCEMDLPRLCMQLDSLFCRMFASSWDSMSTNQTEPKLARLDRSIIGIDESLITYDSSVR